jgi:hypothetical protein
MDDIQPVITVNKYGDKFFRVNGELHRTDGPAIEWTSGKFGKEWFLYGKSLSFNKWLDQHPHMTDEEKVMFKLQYG